jgi:hypothetical protein
MIVWHNNTLRGSGKRQLEGIQLHEKCQAVQVISHGKSATT